MGLVKILQHIFPTTDNIFRFILPSDKNIQGCAGKANHVKAENNSPTGCNELSGSQPQDDVQLLVNESWNQNKFYYWSVQSKYREIPLSRLGKQFRSWHPAWVQNLPLSPFTGNIPAVSSQPAPARAFAAASESSPRSGVRSAGGDK